MGKNIHKLSKSCYWTRVRTALRHLQSMIYHSREIETDTEIVVRTLREKTVKPCQYIIDAQLSVNLANLQEMFADSEDIVMREFVMTPQQLSAAVLFMEGMADQQIINNHILEKLVMPSLSSLAVLPKENIEQFIEQTLLTAASVAKTTNMDEASKRLLAGDTLLLVDNIAAIFIIATRRVEFRGIEEPLNETNVRGPRDGFTEELRVNLTLVRRRLQNPNLVVKKLTIGEQSQTDVAIVYIKGIANPQLSFEVEKRLKKVCIDIPLSAGVIEGLISDYPYSPFPTMVATERPDRLVSGLVEGRVAILQDGSPFCLLAPGVLNDFFQTGDDYYEKWPTTALLRFTRFVAAFFAMATPALYIAITTFHPGFIPTPLALTVAASRLGIPFPAFIEALFMEILLEVMQEAGVRLPKTIGPAVSIVGGLVIGDAAVRAGLVSPGMVIVTAFTAIVTFSMADYRISLPIRLLRVPLMILGASLGLFGLVLGVITVLIHLSILESFGIPYMAPLALKNRSRLKDIKDTFLVVPPSLMKERPTFLAPQNKKRQGGDDG